MLRFVLGSGCFTIDPIDLNRQGITIRFSRTVFVACLKIAMSGGNAAAACELQRGALLGLNIITLLGLSLPASSLA
jgi:hypothetical protein